MDEKITGLSAKEAGARRQNGLDNKEITPPTKTVGEIFATNIFTYFNLIFTVLAAGIIIAGIYKELPIERIAKDLGFMMIIIINTATGIIQELRSKKTLDKMSLLTERKCEVIRDGKAETVGIHDTVLGDVVTFRTGNQIFADATVISGKVTVNEALITGEADEIKKNVGDSLTSGSFVINGECAAELTAVGENSYASRLTIEAKKLKRRGKSEMMRSLTRLVTVIGILIIPLGAAMIIKEASLPGKDIASAVVPTVAALVGMIPEGLYLLTSLALVASVVRLSKKNTLVHELDCVETLARVDTLCVDKTGTITENEMSVESVVPLSDIGERDASSLIGEYIAAQNDDNITMSALKKHFTSNGGRQVSLVLPFSSARKYSGVTFSDGASYFLGAPEFIMGERYFEIADTVASYAASGNRVLLFAAFSERADAKTSDGTVSPVALILLSNRIRETAPSTFRYFADNGVAVKVISGDNPVAVSDIASRAGIPGSDKYIDARELEADCDIARAVEEYTVFGRVTPEQKKKFISALRDAGHTVAMTGDGVNDVLALKEADCSVAMASGSEVAAHASHIVLLDSDFSSMPSVVAEGRRVINNIERSASLYLWKNIFSFALTLITLAFILPYPLEPSQLTLISALTIGIPSFVLAMEPNESRVKGRFMSNVLKRSLPAALTIIISVIPIILLGAAFDVPSAETSTVCAMIIGVVGLLMLFSTSRPFNAIRIALFVLMSAALVLGAVFGAWLFSFVPLGTASSVILASFAALSIPVYLGIKVLVSVVGVKVSALAVRIKERKDAKNSR